MPSGKQLQSVIRKDGTLRVSLETVETAPLQPDQVLVRMEAAPINPSDMGPMFGPADMENARATDAPSIEAAVPEALLPTVAGRLDTPVACGNEGAGIVVEAGDSDAAQALMGKTVAVFAGGGTYSQYRVTPAAMALPLHDGTTPTEGASCFVNPLTVIGMVETMRREGHTALVHTVGASNLGWMLHRYCIAEDVALVNIVRRDEHVTALREAGAKFVCNSQAPSFKEDLTDALAESGATIAFDAIGGGKMASILLECMERALLRNATAYSGYGSSTHKQVYIYGGLDRTTPTMLNRNYGMAWGVGGWLLIPFLQSYGMDKLPQLFQKVADGIKTTFASSYTAEISLQEALDLGTVAKYGRQASGEKYLINPNKGA